jgi:hypothetical protein
MDHTVTPAVKRTVRIENDETETILRGVKLEPFTVVTNYLPEGSLDSIDTPARAYIPLVTEGDVLIANGFMEYTAAKTDAVRKLIYPMHTGSFKDVYYFPNLHELDLTGGDIPLSKLAYSRNDVYNEVGGEAGVPFVRKAGSISDENKQIILGLLASGQFTKVRYYPNSMGLDTDFAPYVTSGVVELVNLPTESLIPNQFLLNGIVENVNFTTDITYPATDAPAGTGLQNIYKMKIMVRDGSLLFALPSEYQFNVQEYPYFKFKVCTPPANLLTDDYAIYKKIWVRFMTKLWSFGNNSVFDQELYNVPKGTVTIDDANLHTWVDVTIPLAETVNNHNRVIILTPGEENTTAATFPPAVDRIYYFANIRFSKTP